MSEYTTEAPPPATIVQTLASENLNIFDIFELFVPCLNSFEGVLPFSGFKTLQVCDSTFVIQHGELQGGSGLPWHSRQRETSLNSIHLWPGMDGLC